MKVLHEFISIATCAAALALANACGQPAGPPPSGSLEVRDPYDRTFSVCREDFIRDCSFDYGDVAIGAGAVLKLSLTARGIEDVHITSANLDGSPLFTLGAFPGTIKPCVGCEGVPVDITFTPNAATDLSAILTVESDAANLREGEELTIALGGSGF